MSEENDNPNPRDDGGRLDPERWIAKHGSAQVALARMATKLDQVEADNAKYRDRIRSLEEAQPGDDALVLTGDAKKRHERWEAIAQGLDDEDAGPDEVLAKLEAGAKAKQEADSMKQREAYRTAAEVEGITNFEAFAGLMNGEGLEKKSETVDGEEKEYMVVTYEEDGEEKTERLREYKKLKPYEASLFGETGQEQAPRGPSGQTPPGHNKPKRGTTEADIREQKKASGDYAL